MSPNLHIKVWTSGNHWATAHKCQRCDRIEFQLYDPNDMDEGNLQCVQPPEGWRSHGYGLLCPECAESYDKWMKKENE